MAQLVVRNLPDDVKERLKRRAACHGHSLEAEVRLLLSQVEDVAYQSARDASWVDQHVRKLEEIGITAEDVDALEESTSELRKSWRMRELEL